jgi:uncharacterized protein YaaR (DUF327 family)
MYRHFNPDILIEVVGLRIIDRRSGAAALFDSNVVLNETDREFGQNINEKRAEGGYKEKLKTLLERIDIQSRKLSERLDIGELKRYRSLVREFLDLSIKNSTQFNKEHTLDSKGRHRIFAIVKKVDIELENLTREVLKQQKDNLNVLAKLDDIRGMLLDIIA